MEIRKYIKPLGIEAWNGIFLLSKIMAHATIALIAIEFSPNVFSGSALTFAQWSILIWILAKFGFIGSYNYMYMTYKVLWEKQNHLKDEGGD